VDGLFDLLCAPEELRAQWRKAIAGGVTLDELTSEAFLQGRNPPLDRWLAQSQQLRCAQRASGVRHRKEVLEIVPVECVRVIHVCRSAEQPCGWR
jgi:hypothetical protein